MANSEIGTSISHTLRGEYQVFLNFRGSDTRRGFTSCLYRFLRAAGICVFMDDEEVRPGQKISGELEQAIDNSKIYIPIFSTTYASSHWCLRELAKMVENASKPKEDGKENVILPIFYDVTPHDVKLKTPLYNEAMSDWEQKIEDQNEKLSSKDVEMWRSALKEVGGIEGWELKNYPSQGDLIDVVLEEVEANLNTRQRQVTEDLVGMKDRIAAIHNLLDIDSGGVRLIVIYGMGGIGKTTLANIIFNRLHPRFGKNCSFLHDVRERTKTKGLDVLRKQLLSDISVARNIDNTDHGFYRIGEIISNKKVVIVLDDVDDRSQIEALIGMGSMSPGTRILVTTRDKSILKIRRFKYQILPYEMEGLSKKDALELFSKHAFNDSFPPTGYYALSKGIVSTMGGLPLALKAIGSLLFDQKEKGVWEEMLENVREAPYGDVLRMLRISYDALNMEQQCIFLDVACLCIGQKKIDAIYVWKDYGIKAEFGLEVLINRCMIKVLDDNSLWMHDQFRDLGRAIVSQENSQYPGKRSRLWASDDIIPELSSTEIKGSVQALCLRKDYGTPITVNAEQIRRFPHLRFLWFSNVICVGDFTGCLSELKWIILEYSSYCPWDPFGCCHTDLKGHYAPKNLRLEKAVVVNLTCTDYVESENRQEVSYLVKGATKLKVLTLQNIRWLYKTPTFSEDSVLEKLTIICCSALVEIDWSIGNLRYLTELRIKSCKLLTKLPEQIGKLQKLKHLPLEICENLCELPDSVSTSVPLTKPDVSQTSITRLPNSNGRLPSLSSSNESSTQIAEMPSIMSKFLDVQTLELNYCSKIRELPKLPGSLTILRLTSTSLLTIPDLSYLPNLVELVLSAGSVFKDTDTPVLSDGSEFGDTDTSNITQPCDLRWIGTLSKLRKLHFLFPNVRAPTTELGSLSLLQELALFGLDLATFKQLPPKLIVLELHGTRVQLLNTAESPERSHIQDCKSSDRSICPPEESGYNELQTPELTDRWRGKLLLPSSLKMLQKFHLMCYPELEDIHIVSTWGSLEEFFVAECISLKSLGGLSELKNMKCLKIVSCKSLQVIEGIDELELLQHLTIIGCESMEMIFDASSSKIPNECDIATDDCGKLPSTFSTVVSWESYREKILKGTKQAPDFEIETTNSGTEIEDPL